MSYDHYDKEQKEMLRKIRGILKKIYIKHEKLTVLEAKKLVEEELGMSSHALPIKLDVYNIIKNQNLNFIKVTKKEIRQKNLINGLI